MMDPMVVRPQNTAVRPRRRTLMAVVFACAIAVSACAGDDEPASGATPASHPASVVPVAPTTIADESAESEPVARERATEPLSTSTMPPTTASTTPITASTTATTTATTTPVTSTTLVVESPPQPAPIAPPADEHAAEPVIEVGSIMIPKLEVDMKMYEGIRLTTLDNGPGHWPGSAMPGEVGNVVVGGHRTSSHRVFRNVDQLAAGDEIIFRDQTGQHTYLVNRVEVVDPSAIWIVDPTDTPTATLFACHPPGSTAQRIVVFADLAESA